MKKMRTETRGRYLPMRNLILRTLVLTGGISVALVAPKTLGLLKKLDRAAANRKDLYTPNHAGNNTVGTCRARTNIRAVC